jgi:hypothetical protein
LENQDIGFCYECQTKDMESTKQRVYRCNECNKWFCELHRTPKFPYFVDWETQFDVQGNPAVKAMFYSEYGRQDGHPDFVYLRNTIEKNQLEERIQNQLIENNMDKMMQTEFPKKLKNKIEQPWRGSSSKHLKRNI